MTISWIDTTGSTNDLARTAPLPEQGKGPVIRVWAALEQTAGRGQRGNKWESEAGKNLTFSIRIDRPGIKSKDQFRISQAAALAVSIWLEERHSVSNRIKWPNDIFVPCPAGDRKICGMLIEHTLAGEEISHTVIGIGLNINQREFSEGAPIAVSLYQITGREYSLEEELESFMELFESIFRREDSLDKAFLGRLYRFGQMCGWRETATGEEFRAKITGVHPVTACLLLEDERGKSRSYAFKEIAYIL